MQRSAQAVPSGIIVSVLLVLSGSILLAGCKERLTSPSEALDPEEELASEADGLTLDRRVPGKRKLRRAFLNAKRKEMGGGIAHYQFEVRVGSGPFDVVRLHRVVREHRPYRPVRTSGGVFMVHGASQDFGDIYLYAGTQNSTPRTSAPLYLAANDIDVWGIDLAWTLIPEKTHDLSFMKDWGLQRDVNHLLAALSIARFLRGATGQGFGRMNLLGFSYSVGLVYVAAGQETQQPWFRRDIGGIVPVDGNLVVSDDGRRQLACDNAEAGRAHVANGRFFTTTAFPRMVNHLATSAPQALSPLPPFEGLTNFQAALQFSVLHPLLNFVAVDFNAEGVPVDLLYSDADRWISLLGGAPPNTTYMPRLVGIQSGEVRCGEKDLALDDHVSEIAVPILYIGAGGGIGVEAGRASIELTASDDVTIHEVSLRSDSERALDYGHADLFIGNNADELVWDVLRKWLVDHHVRAPRPPMREDNGRVTAEPWGAPTSSRHVGAR